MLRRHKILFVAPSLTQGGAERQLLERTAAYDADSLLTLNPAPTGSGTGAEEASAGQMPFGGPGTVQLIETKVVGQGGVQSYGVTSINAGVVTVDDCYVQGATFALSNADGQSPLTANGCQIQGPVGPGVTVNP